MIDAICEGNIAAFAEIFGLPKNTVWIWCKGKSLPKLRAILTVCYCLDISLLDFITLKQQAFQLPRINSQRLPSSLRLRRASPRTFDHMATEKYLQNVLDSPKRPLTMKEVAQRLNTGQRTIHSYFPNLCKAISAKYRRYQKQ